MVKLNRRRVILVLTFLMMRRIRRRNKRTRREWVNTYLQNRDAYGASNVVISGLIENDNLNYSVLRKLRVDLQTLDLLFRKLDEQEPAEQLTSRNPIDLRTKLIVTLGFLSSDESFADLKSKLTPKFQRNQNFLSF